MTKENPIALKDESGESRHMIRTARFPFSASMIPISLVVFMLIAPVELSAADEPWLIEAWDYAEENPPPLRARIGELSPAVTSVKPDTVRYVHQGVNLMMGYWDIEAYRSFLHASRIDPNCAMAYWGMALTMIGSEAALQEPMNAAATKAFELAGMVDGGETTPLSEQEKSFITGLAFYFKNGPEAFAKALKKISEDHPKSRLARLMRILFIRDGYSAEGVPNKGQAEALRLIDDYLYQFPDDVQALSIQTQMLVLGPDFKRADSAARLLAKLKPGTAYMLHLPGLVQYRIGNFDEAIEAFQAAREFDEAFLATSGIAPVEMPFYIKNLEALALTLAEAGRRKEAVVVAKFVGKLEVTPGDFKGMGTKELIYHGMTLESRVHIRYLDWTSALAACPEVEKMLGNRPLPSRVYYEGLRSYAAGRKALVKGEVDVARRALLELEDLGGGAIARIPKAVVTAQLSHWNAALANMDLMVNDLRAQLNAATDSWDLADVWWASMQRREGGVDSDVIRAWPLTAGECKGWAYLQAGYPTEARQAFQQALRANPVSGFALVGLSRAFKAEGDLDKSERSLKLAGSFLKNADPVVRQQYLDEKVAGGEE